MPKRHIMANSLEESTNTSETTFYIDETWNALHPGLEEVFRMARMTKARLMELYTVVYNHCFL